MDQKALKTSWKQRIIIIIIALILFFSTIAMYVGLMLSAAKPSQTTQSSKTNPAVTKIARQYSQKMQELRNNLSQEYLNVLSNYKSEVKAFNAAKATKNGLQTKDLRLARVLK